MLDPAIEIFVRRLSEGYYFPGQRLTEQSIIDDFQISRGNARILLQNLDSIGIVELHKHKGASIRKYSNEEIGDIFLIRQRLEGLAARLAAQNIDEEKHSRHWEFMRKILDEDLQDMTFRQANRIFHASILELSQSSSLGRVIENMILPMQHIQIKAFINERYEEASKAEHKDIAAAILQKDPDAADRLMQSHINNARLRIAALRILNG